VAERHRFIHRQDPAAEGGKHGLLQPLPQQGALGWVAANHQQDAKFQLVQRDSRGEKRAGLHRFGPGRHPRIGLARLHLAQLGHEIGI
jgi:hypothetical protein